MTEAKMTKREKFVDLAEKRVSKALKDIELIGNLSNRAVYEYSDKDVKQIFVALNRVITEARAKFSNGNDKKGSGFSLRP
jgi:hypothetical protein